MGSGTARRIVALALALAVAACAPAATTIETVAPGSPTGAATTAPSPSAPTPTPAGSSAPADAALVEVAAGLAAPIGLVTAPGRPDAFVLDQLGTIHRFADGAVAAAPFLDLTDRLVPLDAGYDERGLLGLAFHPDFAATGRFFVYYAAPLTGTPDEVADHLDRLSEFHVLAGDPNRADPASERVILEFSQPQSNHSGGGLGFGPDGRLYLGVGDGGGQGDASPGHSEGGNAQDPAKLNGKVLRIDVDAGATPDRPYGIPADNPFATSGGRPEIYALGFRNPWRLTWEPDGERRLLVSDVGYGRYEEIDVVVRGGNYGWRIREGAHCLDVQNPLSDLATCATTGGDGGPLIDPVVEYTHAEIGIAVVGGYVYRGAAIPGLTGRYVFADFTHDWRGSVPTPRASLLMATPAPAAGDPWSWRRLDLDGGLVTRFITGMGEDAAGELYVLARDTLGPTGEGGVILQLVPAGG